MTTDPAGQHADGDQDQGHAEPEGEHQDDSQREPPGRLGQQDQDDGIPARHQPAGDAQPDQPPIGFQHLVVGRLVDGGVVLAEAGQMSPQPPESDRGDDAAGHVRQAQVDRAVTLGLRPPEPERHQQHASRVRQGRQQREQHPADPRPPVAEHGRRHQRLAVARLERVDRPQAQGHQDQARRSADAAVRSRSRVSCAEPKAGTIGGVAGRRPRRTEGDLPVRPEAARSPGASRTGAVKSTSTCLVRRSSTSLSCQTGRIAIASTSAGKVIAADNGALPAANGQPARPFAAGIVDVLDRQMAGGRHRGLVMKQEAGMILDGQLEAAETELERPAIDGHQQPATIERAGLPAIAHEPVLPVDPGQDPTSIRRSRVSVSSERLTS